MTDLVPVLLAGGIGSRLWPTSREFYPKQLLDLTGQGSLLQQAVRRALAIAPADRVITVTLESQYFLIFDQLREVASGLGENVLLEPEGRNTAAAVTLAALHAAERFRDPVLWVAPADHLIADMEALEKALSVAREAAERGLLVTFGIEPKRPEPGYGYVRRDRPIEGLSGVFSVASFVEKPDVGMAEELIAAGNCYWNSGMFVFSARAFLDEMKQHAPKILEGVEKAMRQRSTGEGPVRVMANLYHAVPSLPVDKAVMERSSNVAVVPVDPGWSDVGSWGSLWEVSPKDASGNVGLGDVMFENAQNCFARSDRRLVACTGVNDIVVIETQDAILVTDRSDNEGVKAIVKRLKSARRPEAESHLMEHRPWGTFTTLLAGPRYKIKEIMVVPGGTLSLQMHHHRSEHWIVIEGTARITCGDTTRDLHENESTFIPIGEKHRLENPGKILLRIIEVQNGAYVGEDDIIRLEDVYGRIAPMDAEG